MGSLGDENHEIQPMKTPLVDCSQTQPFDTQISTPPLSDEKTKVGVADELMQDTVPFDDTVPVEDAFETQVVNLADETQVMDLGGETQLLDDINCIENMETQLLELDDQVVGDSGSETDTTELLDVNEDLSDDESVRRGTDQLVDDEKVHCSFDNSKSLLCENSKKGLTEQANHLIDEQHNAGLHISTATPVVERFPELKPGSVHMHFTSVRAASLRASGLAARSMALKGTKNGSHSVSSNQSLEQLAVKDNAVLGSTIAREEFDQQHDLGRYNEKINRSGSENKRRIGCSTARKLFTEDSDAENKGFPHNSNSSEEGEDLLQLPCDLAGLSYIDSQEPGELSQANALDFVDKFLQDNVEELDKEVACGKSARENSKFVSSAKGPQTLAKKANNKSIVQDIGIFEWDDSREDEEGGDILRRRKADFYDGGSHGRRSLTQPRKRKGNRPDEQKVCEEQLQEKKKKMGVSHSDSKLLLHNSKVKKKTAHEDAMKHKKNLASEFNEQFNINSPTGQLDANVDENSVPEMLNVGFDTQMAAEAIEALFYGEGISNCDASNAHQGIQVNPKSSPEGSMGEKTKNRIYSKKPSSRKRVHLSDAGDASPQKTRRIGAKSSKHSSISGQENSKNVRKQCETELLITKSKKSKSKAKNHLEINGSKKVEKQHLQRDVGAFTPISRRTRKSMVVNQAENTSSDFGEESNHLTEVVAISGKIISSTGVQASKVFNAKSGPNHSGEVGNIKPSEHGDSDLNFGAISSGIKLDTVSFRRGRRSRQNLSGKVHGPDNLDGLSEPSVQLDQVGPPITRHKRLQGDAKSACVDIKLRETRSSTRKSLVGQHLQMDVGTFTPIARRTRKSVVVNQAENTSSDCGEESNHLTEVAISGKIISSTGIQASKVLNAKSGPNQSGEVGNIKPSEHGNSDLNFGAISSGIKLDTVSFRRGRRSQRNFSGQVHGPDNLDGPSEPSVQPDKVGPPITRHKRLRGDAKSACVDIKLRETRSSTRKSLVGQNMEGKLTQQSLDKGGSWDASLHYNSSDKDGKMISDDITGDKVVKTPDRKSDANPSSVAKKSDASPREQCKPSDSECTTPVNGKVPVNDASPICMGNEYFKQSCKRSLSRVSLLKEIRGLSGKGPERTSASKDLRKRRDMTDVRVLYSHHLDEDIIKQQKKILARLGVSVASSITDATHFIADQFMRTRNMLEAIASGKPVVTHLWLDNCGQASCFIDEKMYILRDTKKEKEFGFSMPASLAHASQHPLLEDRKVFITPNTKPGKEIISSLVKAVNGQAVERIGRSALKGDNIPDDLLVLSCEEDIEICVPLLEKGAAVYSSELLLNGIVTQKLEFERHRLFTEQVKKTRSTVWLRKDGNKFLPVTGKK